MSEPKHTAGIPFLVHETFNSPLGDTGDFEGHSVIRTKSGGVWYADLINPTDEQVEAHEYIVRACNAAPDLLAALKRAIRDELGDNWKKDALAAIAKAQLATATRAAERIRG